jgi:hypothetical protein
MKKISIFAFCFALFLSFAPPAFAQSSAEPKPVLARSAATTDGNSSRSAAERPFSVGETLTYEGKVSKIIKGIAVADLTFTVVNAPQNGDLLVKAEARSKGTLLKLFRFSFLQKLESTIANDEFYALKTVKHDAQKDRIRNSEANFNYSEGRVTYVESDPNEPMRPPRKIASEISGETHDLISGLYSLRLMPLEVGKTFNIKVSDSGLVYDIPVKVVSKESQKTIFGKIQCFRIEPQVFGRGRLIEKEGSMIIWIADDQRRIPVRSQINTTFGRIEVRLRAVKNEKAPAI